MSSSRVVAESELGETVETVVVFQPSGETVTIPREQLQVIEPARLAVAWKDTDGKTHRCFGLPFEMISTESRIVKPM